ncbi:uncharacterized protein LOC142558327 [Dermacentor variabilis]|uniref:uncharacterized protein LOC142558327 n=1 Tax=Dermacentor variabilis TaxID=34621 RepID=UPI003F5C5F7A
MSAQLGTASWLSTKRPSQQQAYTVLALALKMPAGADAMAQKFRDVYTPDIVVTKAHYRGEDKTAEDCLIVPPTIMFVPSGNPYFCSMICKNSSFAGKHHDENVHAQVMYSRHLERVFVYDDAYDMRIKLCFAKRYASGYQYGIAAFDMEYADTNNDCGNGSYRRLRTLRKTLDFLKVAYNTTGVLKNCVSGDEQVPVEREKDDEVPKEKPAAPLICTVGDTMTRTMAFPEDGICDVIVFDSIEKENVNPLGGPHTESFKAFLEKALNQSNTLYGVGFDYGTLTNLQQTVGTPRTGDQLNNLWSSGISVFGYVNTPAYYFRQQDLSAMLTILKVVSSLMSKRAVPRRPAYTVMALVPEGPWALTTIASIFKRTYVPDFVIFKSHLFGQDSELAGCKVLPPTYVFTPPTLTYGQSLFTGHDTVRQMTMQGVNTTMSVSVALYGRWYKPLIRNTSGEQTDNYSLLQDCDKMPVDQHGSVSEHCADQNSLVYDTSLQANIFIEKKLQRLFVYDDAKSLMYKLCYCKRGMLEYKYGVAAYNLEMADTNDKCGNGPYHVLRAIKDLVSFMATNFTRQVQFESCYDRSQRDKPATTTPLPAAPPERSPLVCVYGRRTTPRTRYPDDGVCDYLVYSGVHRKDGDRLGAAYSAELVHFLGRAMGQRRSQYAVGLDYNNYEETAQIINTDEIKIALDKLWVRGISHFGFLNTPIFYFTVEAFTSLLKSLKELGSWMNTRRTPVRAAHTILAMNFDPYFLEFMRKENFVPDIFVSLGHFFHNDQAFPKCFIVPPTYLRYPAETTYPISMPTAHDHIRQYRAAGINSTMAVSVTMYGRWYKPMWADPAVVDKPGNYGVRHRCTFTGRESQLGSILELCTNKTSKTTYYDVEEHATLMYNKEQQFSFVYDDPVSLRYKLCTCKREMIGYKYGVAIYDMEGADDYGVCGNGTFFRLKDLRSTLDFIRDKFTSQEVYERCIDPSKPLHLSTKGVPRTVQPTVPPVNVDKPLQSPLICTFGVNFTAHTPLPDDGLCDYLFYTTMDSEGGSSYSIFKEDFLHFLSAASDAQSKTKYGVGFNYNNREQMKQTWLSQSGDKLLDLWKRGISLFGYLDVPPYYFNMDSAKSLLLNIKGMVELLRPVAVGRRPFTVFSAVIARPLWGSPLAKAFQEIYQPDIVVSLGHYYMQDKEWDSCMIVPPTLFDPAPGKAYFYSLGTAHEAVRDIADAGAQVVVAPSVALFGRWYKPYSANDDGNPGNYSIFQECDNIPEYQMDSFTKICDNDSFTKYRATEVHSQFFYSKAFERIFTYDNGDAYAYKH